MEVAFEKDTLKNLDSFIEHLTNKKSTWDHIGTFAVSLIFESRPHQEDKSLLLCLVHVFVLQKRVRLIFQSKFMLLVKFYHLGNLCLIIVQNQFSS